jgi:hypothetical protein
MESLSTELLLTRVGTSHDRLSQRPHKDYRQVFGTVGDAFLIAITGVAFSAVPLERVGLYPIVRLATFFCTLAILAEPCQFV